jgi:hypothetical protein
MLNDEFETCDSREGIIVRISADQKDVRIFSVDGEREDLRWQGNVDDTPRVWRESLRSATSLYRKCLSLSTETAEEDTDGTAKCVPGVGWCATRDKKMQFLFEDGVRMEIDREARNLIYCDLRQRKERWRLTDEDLPRYIRERLEQCSVFRDVE